MNKGQMSYEQFLLWKLSEECNEIGQGCSKAAQFGLDEVYPTTGESNRDRIIREINDLIGILKIIDETLFPVTVDVNAIEAKREKVLKYLRYSVGLGTVHHSALDHFEGG